MDESAPSQPTLDVDALVRALARHYTDCDPGQTLQQALGCLADACWTRADETAIPDEDETAARDLISEMLDYGVKSGVECRKFRAARRVFAAGRFSLPGAAKDPLGPRLLRTYWLMANCLWETWISDPARRCVGGCQGQRDCDTLGECQLSLVYPYLREVAKVSEPANVEPATVARVPNWNKTADAIVDGLSVLRHDGKLNYRPDQDAVRHALQRRA